MSDQKTIAPIKCCPGHLIKRVTETIERVDEFGKSFGREIISVRYRCDGCGELVHGPEAPTLGSAETPNEFYWKNVFARPGGTD